MEKRTFTILFRSRLDENSHWDVRVNVMTLRAKNKKEAFERSLNHHRMVIAVMTEKQWSEGLANV